MNQCSSWKVPEAFIWITINFCKSRGLILSGVSLSRALSRAWTLASTSLSCYSSHRSCGVNYTLWEVPTSIMSFIVQNSVIIFYFHNNSN
jgi:hypothetical protein